MPWRVTRARPSGSRTSRCRSVALQVVADFGLERAVQHLPRAFEAQGIQRRSTFALVFASDLD